MKDCFNLSKMNNDQDAFQSATRVQVSIITAAEKRKPSPGSPGACWHGWGPTISPSSVLLRRSWSVSVYALSPYNRQRLVWGVLFLVLNWFGDSLDGALARYRNRQRPRYGFYVD